jgi:osmotically-inducible protein OsmY
MSFSKCLMTAALVGVVSTGPACTDKAVDETKRDAGAALDATRAGVDKAIDATKKAGHETAGIAKDVAKDVAHRTADKTTELAGQVAEKSKEAASAAGVVVTDGWTTTKVQAKFADEPVLKGSDINVDTHDHVVTLMGTVRSGEAKARAAVVARDTARVARVVNQLVVKPK